VARHSGAQAATVGITRRGERLELSVEDDGVGFDSERPIATAEGTVGGSRGGVGLGSMRQRVEASGGSFSVTSAAGRGTRVSAPSGSYRARPTADA